MYVTLFGSEWKEGRVKNIPGKGNKPFDINVEKSSDVYLTGKYPQAYTKNLTQQGYSSLMGP